jgi:hypothetical protein
LIGILNITPSDTSHPKEEINVSQKIPPEDTTDKENPNPMSPQVGSSMTTTTQRRSTRLSSGMGMTTALIDLITIYDDEEGS